MSTRSGKRYNIPLPLPLPYLPPDVLAKIFKNLAKSGPQRAITVAQVSKLGKEVAQNNIAIHRLKKVLHKIYSHPNMYWKYRNANIPKSIGLIGIKIGSRIGTEYRKREAVKKNFRNRISKLEPINDGTYYNDAAHYTYELNGRVLRRTRNVGPGAASVQKYIGTIL
jgi:hypothetical protein